MCVPQSLAVGGIIDLAARYPKHGISVYLLRLALSARSYAVGSQVFEAVHQAGFAATAW